MPAERLRLDLPPINEKVMAVLEGQVATAYIPPIFSERLLKRFFERMGTMGYNDQNVSAVNIPNNLVQIIDEARARASHRMIEVEAGDGSGRMIRGVLLDIEGGKTQIVFPTELNQSVERPDRIRATVQLRDVDSFSKYVKQHKNDATRVFAIETGQGVSFVAIIDMHDKGAPSFMSHRASLTMEVTPEWARWAAMSGKLVQQQEFAEFIAENKADILEPVGADVLEMVRDMQADSTTQFAGRQVEHSGSVKFVYDEQTKATTGRDGMTVPERFVLNIATHKGLAPQKIVADFRYALRRPNLALGIIIRAQDRIMRDAVKLCQALIETDVEVPVYIGNIV